METHRPSSKSTIHNHPTYCDDKEARNYLRKLSFDEAKTVYGYAKEHGNAAFEIRIHNERYNYRMEYDDGAYIIHAEGKQKSGWL